MTETATSKTMREREEHRTFTRLQEMQQDFRSRYAPADPHARDEFEARLVMLMREVSIDAQKPFVDAASKAFTHGQALGVMFKPS